MKIKYTALKLIVRVALLAGLAVFSTPRGAASVSRSNDDPTVIVDVTVKTTHWVYNWWYNAFVVDFTEFNTYSLHAGESIDFPDAISDEDSLIYEVDSESSRPNPDYTPPES